MLVAERERSYNKIKPQPMIMKPAPNAGLEAQRIWDIGKRRVAEVPLSPDREIGVGEAIKNSFAFVQISGLKAGGSKDVANISTALTWDRQTPIEDCAEEIVQKIGGSEVQLRWFGPHKLVGFVKGGRPEAKLIGLVDAPKQAYVKHLPHLAKAQSEIQKRRVKDILDPFDGTGKEFLSAFNGEKQEFKRAYQDNNRYSFTWPTQKVNDKLMGINLDNQRQAVAELATDEDTRQMLEAMQEFLAGVDSQNRYFIEFDFSETVSCCNISFNAQHAASHVWNNDALSILSSDILKYPNGETYFSDTICVSCLKKEKSCICKKDEKKEE